MEEWQSALWVAVIAATSGLVGALIGRERWPADLRDAKRLGEIVDKMEPGSKEREFAAMHRDDLASRWIISRVAAPNDIRRDLGLILTVSGTVTFVLGGLGLPIAAAFGFLGPDGDLKLPTAFLATILLGSAEFGIGIWLSSAYLRRRNQFLTDLREARGMRTPIGDWVSEFERTRKQSMRTRRKVSPAAASSAPAPTATPAASTNDTE